MGIYSDSIASREQELTPEEAKYLDKIMGDESINYGLRQDISSGLFEQGFMFDDTELDTMRKEQPSSWRDALDLLGYEEGESSPIAPPRRVPIFQPTSLGERIFSGYKTNPTPNGTEEKELFGRSSNPQRGVSTGGMRFDDVNIQRDPKGGIRITPTKTWLEDPNSEHTIFKPKTYR